MASVAASAAPVARAAAGVVTVLTSLLAAVISEEVAGTVNGNGKLLGR